MVWGMMKEPLVKQRSRAPPLTVSVTMASNSDMGQGAKEGRRVVGPIQDPASQSRVIYQRCHSSSFKLKEGESSGRRDSEEVLNVRPCC